MTAVGTRGQEGRAGRGGSNVTARVTAHLLGFRTGLPHLLGAMRSESQESRSPRKAPGSVSSTCPTGRELISCTVIDLTRKTNVMRT